MRPKLVQRDRAIRLRHKGQSLKEISFSLGVSKASVSLWVRNIELSNEAKRILQQKKIAGQLRSQEFHRKQTQKLLAEAADIAKKDISKIKISPSLARLLCGLMYWCEGEKSKNDGSLYFTNSDPNLVAIFLRLLRNGFEINENKLRACVHLHEYHDREKQLQFWSRVTNISRTQFTKPYIKPHTGKRSHINYQGCISVRYHDVRVARRVLALGRTFIEGPIG